MKKNMVIAGVVVVLLITGGVWLTMKPNINTNDQQLTKNTQPVTTPGNPAVEPTGSASGETEKNTQEFTVTGSNFKFEPSEIKVKTGERIKITFKPREGSHDFIIDELNVATKKIGANGFETVEFTVDKAGQFTYYCSVANHRAMGMKGTLIVE